MYVNIFDKVFHAKKHAYIPEITEITITVAIATPGLCHSITEGISWGKNWLITGLKNYADSDVKNFIVVILFFRYTS